MGIIYHKSEIVPVYIKLTKAGLTSGVAVELGTIPMGARMLMAQTAVSTAFNGTSNVWRVGTSAGGLEIAFDEDVTNVGVIGHHRGMDLGVSYTADRLMYGRYTGDASAGELHFTAIFELGF